MLANPSRHPLPYRPIKPYISPAREQKSMTIVAGFSCKDGIILAADTLVSYETSKGYESKIFDIGGEYRTVFVAYSGDTNATKDIKEQLKDAIAGLQEEKDVITALKTTIKQIHQERYTSAPKEEKVFLNLLIALRDDPKEQWNLYCVSGRNFFPVDSYSLLGIGQDVGRTIFEPYYRKDMTIWEAKFLAAYGVSVIKNTLST
jgi:20S proteasome alpha/beta subunit